MSPAGIGLGTSMGYLAEPHYLANARWTLQDDTWLIDNVSIMTRDYQGGEGRPNKSSQTQDEEPSTGNFLEKPEKQYKHGLVARELRQGLAIRSSSRQQLPCLASSTPASWEVWSGSEPPREKTLSSWPTAISAAWPRVRVMAPSNVCGGSLLSPTS
jgi:hypothetical protein